MHGRYYSSFKKVGVGVLYFFNEFFIKNIIISNLIKTASSVTSK